MTEPSAEIQAPRRGSSLGRVGKWALGLLAGLILLVVGALVGVCLAWTMTDLLLGMKAQIMYSLVTLGVALFWCQIMIKCFVSSERKTERSEPLMIV